MRSKIFLSTLFRQLFGLVLSYAVLSGAFVAVAQTRRRPPARRAPATQTTAEQPRAKCNGGWSGTITFTKTLDEGVFIQLRKWLALPPSADFAPDASASTGGSGN